MSRHVPSVRALGVAVLLAATAAACAKPEFTEAVRARFGLTPRDIERIQFYTSREIILQREIGDQSKTVSANGLQIRDGVRIEEIEIPEHTPGVALRVEGDYILVSFSRQHPERALWFGLKKTDDHAVLTDAHEFELVHLENPLVEQGPFRPIWSKGFLVTYAGQRYRVVDGQAWSAHLLYDLDESFAKEKVREEPPGWRLADGPFARTAPVPASASAAPVASAAATAAPEAATAPVPVTPDGGTAPTAPASAVQGAR